MGQLIEKLGERVMECFSYVYGFVLYILFPIVVLCKIFAPDETKVFQEFFKTYMFPIFIFGFFGLPLLLFFVAIILFFIEEWKKEAQKSNKLIATILLILTVILFAAVTYFGGNADVPYSDIPYAHPYKR